MQTSFKEEEYQSGFNFNLWKKMIVFLKPFKKYIFGIFVFSLIAAICEANFPVLIKFAFDNLITDDLNMNSFYFFSFAYIALSVIQPMSFYFLFRNTAKIEAGYGANIRDALFRKTMNLSFNYFDQTPLGWILARLTSDVTRISEIVSWSLFDLSWGLLSVIISIILMLIVDLSFGLLLLSFIPIIFIITYIFQKYILKAHRLVRKRNSIITGAYNEGIVGAKTTKSLAIEDNNYMEFKKETELMKLESIKAGKLLSVYRPIVNSFGSIAIAFVLWIGGNRVFNNVIELGTLIMFCQYCTQFFEPISQFANLLSDIQLAQANAERVMTLVESEPQVTDTKEVIEKYGDILNPKVESFEEIDGKVTFENVSFSYIPNEMILDDFSLEVKSRETVALVGATGGGKSTIINLLSRFYEPTKGRILIDDVDYKERSISFLHSRLGYVLQTPQLFTGSIIENIRYGKLDATIDEVINVCKLVNAHDFIMKLKDGYDSQIGEGGGFLSTGQKQLISFARALIHDPKIVILDEATSSIDTESELLIQKAIQTIIKDKTTFIVAHRLSTIVNADTILVIKKGKIVEKGNHQDLMNLKNHYYRLYTNQFSKQMEDKLLKTN